MTKSIVDWARLQIATHPQASDAHPVIPEVLVGGTVRSPAVTLGELRAMLLAVERANLLSSILRHSVADATADDLSLLVASKARDQMAEALDLLALYHGADDLSGAAQLVRAALGRVDGVVAKMRR